MRWYCYNIHELTDAKYQKWYSLANAEKRNRVDRMRMIDDRKRSIAGEMLARHAISEWCKILPEEIVFDKDELGKPFAKNLPVEFNISHSGALVVCAVDSTPVGIDVEQIRSIDWKLAKFVCTEEELVYMRGENLAAQKLDVLPTQDMLRRFFEIWTAKEAYVKCTGTGIVNPKSVNALQYIKDGCCIHRESYVISICQKAKKM